MENGTEYSGTCIISLIQNEVSQNFAMKRYFKQ